MNTVKLILWGSIVWILPLLFFMQKNEAKFKKNIVIGVTLPYEAREDREVNELLRIYKRDLGLLMLLCLGLIVPFMLPKSMTWTMCLWSVWLIAVIVLTALPFIQTNRKLKAIKAARGWKKAPSEDGVVMVDTSNIILPKWRSSRVFYASAAASLLPILFVRESWVMSVTLFLTQVLFYLTYRYCFRLRSEAVDANVELTVTLTELRRRLWGNFWVLMSGATALYSILCSLSLYHGSFMIWATLIYTLFTICICFRIEMKLRSYQEKLTTGSGKSDYLDDDDHWIWGMFYYNENDSHSIVNMRTGMGTTVNLARPLGKWMMLTAIVVLVFLPFMEFLIDSGMKTEISYVYNDTFFTAVCGKSEYEVMLGDIEKIEILEMLPENMTRLWGTSAENILKGNFSIEGVGSVKVLVNPGHSPYVMITGKSGMRWLLEGGDTEEGKEFLEYIRTLDVLMPKMGE